MGSSRLLPHAMLSQSMEGGGAQRPADGGLLSYVSLGVGLLEWSPSPGMFVAPILLAIYEMARVQGKWQCK
jgi:hypothetical protein